MPPATAAPARTRRQQVLDASAALFARRGFDGVGVADIAEEVGLSAPALYRHFASKEAIVVSLTLGTLDRLHAIVERRRDGNAPLVDCLRELVAEVLDRPDGLRVYLRERHRLRGDDAAALVAREREMLQALVGLLGDRRPDLAAEDVARRLVATSGVLQAFAERRPPLPRPAAEIFVAGALDDMVADEPVVAPEPVLASPPSGGWSPKPSQSERILRAALPLFRERGYDRVGVGEIGEAAGIGAANVSRYFESREEILVDLYDRVGARVEAGVDEALARASDATDALDRLVDSYCAIAFAAADLVAVVSNSRGALPASERPRLRRRDRRIMSVWRAVVAELRPDLRQVEVRTLCIGVMPLVNMFPQQMYGRLPPPRAASSLVRAFVLGPHRVRA
ncbi:MAG: TetR/AcrR family transcriptional regulator [Acidimicrobiales bacterium]